MAKRTRRTRGLAGISVVDLHAELQRRATGLPPLQKRYDELADELAGLAAEIEALGGTANGHARGRHSLNGVRRRPKNSMNLVEALGKVLNGSTMSVTEVAEAVQKAGYKTTSPSFRTIVNQTLINSGKFKRVGRGQYTAK